MRYPLIFLVLILLVIAIGITSKAIDVAGQTSPQPTAVAGESAEMPIAPGVWYPGDALPEQPMRYYRVRCFPGCHRGSSYGKYPDEPLNMKPIFPTSSIDRCRALSKDAD
jgi:hypothetical protein